MAEAASGQQVGQGMPRPRRRSSDVRVDLAVRDPADPTRFALGVVTDGVNHARFATARDRAANGPALFAAVGVKQEQSS